jgi:hypothetical protein
VDAYPRAAATSLGLTPIPKQVSTTEEIAAFSAAAASSADAMGLPLAPPESPVLVATSAFVAWATTSERIVVAMEATNADSMDASPPPFIVPATEAEATVARASLYPSGVVIAD